MEDLDGRLKTGGEMNPKKKFLIIFMFTGRAVTKGNMTEIVLNEFDELT